MTINEYYEKHGLHKWWQEELPNNSIIHELGKKNGHGKIIK